MSSSSSILQWDAPPLADLRHALLSWSHIARWERANQIVWEAAGEPKIDIDYFLLLNQRAEIPHCINGEESSILSNRKRFPTMG